MGKIMEEALQEIGQGLMVGCHNTALERKGIISGFSIGIDLISNNSLVYPLNDNLLGDDKGLQEQGSRLAYRMLDLAEQCRGESTEECRYPKYKDLTFISVIGAKDSEECFVKLSVINSGVIEYRFYESDTDDSTRHIVDRDFAHDIVQKGKFYRDNIDRIKEISFISLLRSACQQIGHTKDIIFMSFAPIRSLEEMFKENEATFEEKNSFIKKLNNKVRKIDFKIIDLNVTKIKEVINAMNLNDKQELKDKFLQCRKELKILNNVEKIRDTKENKDVEDALESVQNEQEVPSTLKKLSLISLGSLQCYDICNN